MPDNNDQANQISQGFNNAYKLGLGNSPDDSDEDEKKKQELMRLAQQEALKRIASNNNP